MTRLNRIRAATGAALSSGTALALAAAPDFSDLTDAVDFSTVGTALIAIGAVLMVPKVVKWGVSKVLSMVRG